LALLWQRSLDAGLAAGAAHEGRYRFVRFEELLAAPDRIMKSLCTFFGLDYAPSLTKPTRRTQMEGEGTSGDVSYNADVETLDAAVLSFNAAQYLGTRAMATVAPVWRESYKRLEYRKYSAYMTTARLRRLIGRATLRQFTDMLKPRIGVSAAARDSLFIR
jgi:hypothetical protein